MKKILILEKGKEIYNKIKIHVGNEDCKLIVPGNDNSNFSSLKQQIPDIVVADLTTIKNDKVELLMQLKNNPVLSLVPFLLITSGSGNNNSEIHQAQNYYLQKPYKKSELINLIKKILNNTSDVSPW